VAKLKLTEEKGESIVRLIEEGNYSSTASQASGVSERSFWRYMERGEKAAGACEAWDEAVEVWNSLSDQERRKNPDLKPDEKDMPLSDDIFLWQFWRDVKKAEARAENAAIQTIQKASEKNWQASAWWLERKFKDRWGRQDKTIHEGSVAHNHQLLPTSPEAIEAGRQRLEAAREEQKKLEGGGDVIDAEVVEE
jgi:hypothetical protein